MQVWRVLLPSLYVYIDEIAYVRCCLPCTRLASAFEMHVMYWLVTFQVQFSHVFEALMTARPGKGTSDMQSWCYRDGHGLNELQRALLLASRIWVGAEICLEMGLCHEILLQVRIASAVITAMSLIDDVSLLIWKSKEGSWVWWTQSRPIQLLNIRDTNEWSSMMWIAWVEAWNLQIFKLKRKV